MTEGNSKFLPYEEHSIMTGEGEHFPMFIAYQGGCIYFGSLDRVRVPAELQAELSGRLFQAIESGSFPQTITGDTHEGIIEVPDGNRVRLFKVILNFKEAPKDDYFQVESILELP